jgi:hypothetical protein
MAIRRRFLARIAGRLLVARPKRITSGDLAKADFKTTQRMGLRFTDRIRDVFRFKWLKTNKE